MRVARLSVSALGCCMLLSLAGPARGQVMAPFAGGMMSPQMNTMMGMRMMQGFGGGGVQTGMQNPIISGGYGSQPQLYNEPTGSMAGGKHGSKKSSYSKRDEARAQRAEQKRAAAAAKAKPKAEKVAKKSRKPQNQ